MRLIDANALIEALVMWRDNDPHRKIRTLWERLVRKTGINVLIKVVSVFPTIEAHTEADVISAYNEGVAYGAEQAVRHGRWIVQDEGRTRFMCSECKSKNHRGSDNYCPNCGAKMDGGADNEV